MKISRFFLLLIFLIAPLLAAVNVNKITVYVIGDSTACLYKTTDYPRTGWAQVLQPFFNADNVIVNDQAASGRSSKSFYDEGRWTTVYNLLKPGDFVFIQFAHNDEKTTDAARYTDPQTTFKDYISIYIHGAIAKGATPVLISSIPRNNWSGSGIQQAHKPYTQAMIELVDSFHIPFVDMEAATMKYLNFKGKTFATDSIYNNLKAGVWTNYLTGNSDGTHLQENGAYQLCKVLTDEIRSYQGNAGFESLAQNIVQAGRISAMPFPDLKGVITGTGVFAKPQTVSLTATPIAGYRFVKWMENGETTAIGTNPIISLQLSDKDISISAYFESTTGFNLPLENQLRLYPNPVTDVIHLNTNTDKAIVQLTDMHGKRILYKENTDQLNLTTLPKGNYILHVQTDKQKYSGIIQKK